MTGTFSDKWVVERDWHHVRILRVVAVLLPDEGRRCETHAADVDRDQRSVRHGFGKLSREIAL
jgi:hypothetical protein